MKNRLWIILLVVMALCLLGSAALADTTGACGDNVQYTLSSDGTTLTISGTGPMASMNLYPWQYEDEVCDAITTLIVENGVTVISKGAFCIMYGLTSVSLPNSLEVIGVEAFYCCPALRSISIPNSVSQIGESAFRNCASLEAITIPDGITEICKNTFTYCDALKSIGIPNSVQYIREEAFYNCESLESIVITNSVTQIGEEAFHGCSSLTSVTIPNSITKINDSVFRNCSGLTSVTIPDSITEIDNSAFAGCSSLTSVTIPNSVAILGKYAFESCSSLTEIVIPSSITVLDENVFSGCSSLTGVTIPGSIRSISDFAFGSCSSLKSLRIESSNCTVSEHSFTFTEIETVFIPGDMQSIRTWPLYNWDTLKDVYFEGTGAQWSALLKGFNISLPVHWRCQVSFDKNGHGAFFNPQTQKNLWSNESRATDPGGMVETGYVFTGWYTDAACEHLWDFSNAVPGDMTLYAGWEPKKYHVYLFATDDDGATVTGAGDYPKGEVVTLGAQPGEGHYFIRWDVNSGGVTVVDGQFTMPENDVIIVGRFGLLYDVSLAVFPENCGTVTASASASPAGSQVTLTAVPAGGYHFMEWRIVPDSVSIDGNAFLMPAEDVTVTAVFMGETPYPISSDGSAVATVFDGWTGIVAAQAVHGEEVSLSLSETAAPRAGCYFTGEFTYYFTGEPEMAGVSLGRKYDDSHLYSWPVVDFVMPAHAITVTADQARREAFTLNFTRYAALTLPHSAWMQLQNQENGLILLDEDRNEYLDLNRSGVPDLAVTAPDFETAADYTLTLLPGADAAGTFSFVFTGAEDRFSPIAMVITAPVFGPASFTLPDSPTVIEAGAFEGDTSITIVDAGRCTSIGAGAFGGCTALTQIRLPVDCHIDPSAFDGCGVVFVFAPADGTTQTACAAIPSCVFIPD